MARKRMIDPSFWDDLNVAKLSRPARLCFLGMMSNADDEGRIEADPRYIKRAVFGFDDDLSSSDVSDLLAEIQASCPSVVFYQVEGRALAFFTNWKRYQYIQKPQPSRLPPMPLSYEYRTAISSPPAPDDTGPNTPQKHDKRMSGMDQASLSGENLNGASQSDKHALPYQYDTDTVPVSPNRIEKNRKEKNRNGGGVEDRLTAIFEHPGQVETIVTAAARRGGFSLADVETCEAWLKANPFDKNIGTLYNILKAGKLPTLGNSSKPQNGTPQPTLTQADVERDTAAMIESDPELAALIAEIRNGNI